MSISEGSSVASDLFITEVDAERQTRFHQAESEDLLVNVRKDHLKVREVVNAFRSKVDRLIDKQRHEYIQAYESHMQDVQKELHSMREKVFEIANDDTKNERTDKLKSDLDNFKDEAIRLETDADELRITMSNLVRRIYSVERSRDWMLKKLRQAKKKYNTLIKEKVKLLEIQSQASLSNDSSYTIEMKRNSNNRTASKSNNFAQGLMTSGRIGRSLTLPSLKCVPSSSGPLLHANKGYIDVSQEKLTSTAIERRPNTLSGLVAARTSHEEVKSFVQHCSSSLHRRPWSKVQRRPFDVLLNDCFGELKHLSANIEERLVPLACELACTPEVYEVLSGLMVLHFEKLPQRRKDDDIESCNNTLLSWQVDN